MSDRLIVELDAEGELQARLARAITGMQHPQALMEAIGARLMTNIQLRFETKTDPDGYAWLPLAASTKARYAKQDTGADGTQRRQGSLLQRTGLMLQSLGYLAGDTQLEIGFSRPYAYWHEIGTQRMPRRSMLMGDPVAGRLGETDRQDVLDELEDFLAGALG